MSTPNTNAVSAPWYQHQTHSSFPSPSDDSNVYHYWSNTLPTYGQTTHLSTTSRFPSVSAFGTPGQPFMGAYGVSAPENHLPSTFQSYHNGSPGKEKSYNIMGTPPALIQSSQNDQRSAAQRESTQPPAISDERSVSASPRPAQQMPKSRGKKNRQRVRSRPSRQLHRNCHGEEVQPALVENCPSEERLLCSLRWKHREAKGADMWVKIQADFKEQTHIKCGIEVLQMRYRRARSKYYRWETKDKTLLCDAFKCVEGERYQRILDCFINMGGSSNMLLSPTDIEVKLVELGLEEDMYMDENQRMRRRRKQQKRKRRLRSRIPKVNNQAEPSPDDDLMSIASSRLEDVLDQVHGPLIKTELT